MKIVSILAVAIMLSNYCFGQQRAIELSSKWEGESLVYSAKNNDVCDYYIEVSIDVAGFDHIASPYMGTVRRRSSSRLFSLKRSTTYASISTNISFHYFRGDFRATPQIDFAYALPVKQMDSVFVIPKEDRNYTIRFLLSNASDTVYACRSGVVCNNDLTDTSSKGNSRNSNLITIFHKDATMAEYSSLSKSLVDVGDNVRVGDPIALAAPMLIPNQNGYREVCVGVYFLDKNKIANRETGSKHTHFVPVFQTVEHLGKLMFAKTYKGVLTEDLIMKDLTKSEKTKALKRKDK